MGSDRRSYKQWSCEETVALHRGVERYNKRWIAILTDPELAQVLSGRVAVQLKDKWRNIQKCEKRRNMPRREAHQRCVSLTTSTPAGSARLPPACNDIAAGLDPLPEGGRLQQRRSGRFTAAPRKCYAADSESGEEDADDEDFQCKYQDEKSEGSTAGEEEQTASERQHAHKVIRVSALAGSPTAAQSSGLSLPRPVSVSKRRIVTARAGPSLGPAGKQLGLPGVAMPDTLDSGDSEQSVLLGAFQAAPRQQEGPAALCMPPQGLSQDIPLQGTLQLQHPWYSAELLQALMRSAGAMRQQGPRLDTLCGALPGHHPQQQQLWRDQGAVGTVMAQGLEALQGLEGAAMGCAPPARCPPQQALVPVCLLAPFSGQRQQRLQPRLTALPTAGTRVCLWLCVLAEGRLRCSVCRQRCCRGVACRLTSSCLPCCASPEP